MDTHLSVFPDFHLHGASAPEWNQRYLQMSPGLMRSSLAEWSVPGAHVFRKWMSERVVQQGGLPRGQVCFALLAREPAQAMRVQGREFMGGDLLVLHGGDEFEFQRPAGAELVSLTFAAESFDEFIDAPALRRLARGIVRPSKPSFAMLQRLIAARLSSDDATSRHELMNAVLDALRGSEGAPAPRAASVAAARLVKSCEEIAMTQMPGEPMRVEELCLRLRTSRRTLQGSFNRVAGTSPLAYLRNLRLNSVRRRLLASAENEINVSTAAGEAGFDHFGHFAGAYRALFGEVPSRTQRRR